MLAYENSAYLNLHSDTLIISLLLISYALLLNKLYRIAIYLTGLLSRVTKEHPIAQTNAIFILLFAYVARIAI